MFKEMPELRSNNEVTMAKNYLLMALTAYKATTEVMFIRLLNVTVVCQIIKPILQDKNFSWTHQAVFSLIRSAANIFLMKLLQEFYELKFNLLKNEDDILKNIEGNTIEETTTNLINWFIFNDVVDCSNISTLFESRYTTPINAKRQKGSKKRRQGSEDKQKVTSIESAQKVKDIPKSVGCRIRILVGFDKDSKMNATIITSKEEVDYQFWYPKRNKVINEYKNIKDYYSWNDEFEDESESAKCINSPRVFDLRTPQKKSRMIELMSDTTSDDDDDLFVNKVTDKNMDPKTKKPTVPVKLASIPSSKPVVFDNYSTKPLVSTKTTGSSFVDQILLEESRRANQTTSGSIVQLRQ